MAIIRNTLQRCGMGVSVVVGAGRALIASNMLGTTQRGAILGMGCQKIVTGDLATAGSRSYLQLQVDKNQVICDRCGWVTLS